MANFYTDNKELNRITSYNVCYTKLLRIQYDYKGRYLLSVSARHDGSSRFGQDYRWGTFPSVSVGWNVSDESFWQNMANTVNSFKVRASYGTTGNQSFKDYSYSATISSGFDYPFGTEADYYLSLGNIQTGFANPQVQWETSIQNRITSYNVCYTKLLRVNVERISRVVGRTSYNFV